MSAYRELEEIFARIAALGEAAGMLHWDMSVMMPVGGAEARAEQLAALRLTTHEMLTDARTLALLDEAEAGTGGNGTEAGEDETAAPWRRATSATRSFTCFEASATMPRLRTSIFRPG